MTSPIRGRRTLLAKIGVAVATAITAATVASSATMAATSTTTASSAKPVYGGELTVGIGNTIAGFCINNVLASSDLGVARTIFETLFERETDGSYVGLLAKSGTPSADLKTWTITLRPNITFSDGEPFDAAAVKLNIDANSGMQYLATAATANPKMTWTLSTGVAVNANIVSVTVVDPLTLTIQLDHAQADFLGTLYRGGRYMMRAPNQINDGSTCSTKPIGTGPFMLQNFDQTNGVTVVKNPSYWRTDPVTGAKLPYLDKINFTIVKDSSQRAAAVRKGVLDAGSFTSSTDSTFIKDLRLHKTAVTEYRSNYEWYQTFAANMGKAGNALLDQNARLALAYGFDCASYLKVRLKGEGLCPTGIFPASQFIATTKNAITYNLAKAKYYEGLYEQQYGKPVEFTMPADTSPQSQASVKFLADMWAKAGIKADIDIAESAVIVSRFYNSKTGGNDYDVYNGAVMEGGDAAYVVPFLLGNVFSPTATQATSAFKNSLGSLISIDHSPDTNIDNMIYAGEAAATKAAAQAQYRAAVAEIQRQALIIGGPEAYFDYFTSKKLHGIGVLQTVKGKHQPVVTNWGFSWAGIWKSKK